MTTSGTQVAAPEKPPVRRETLLDVAVRRKEVLVAKSVVEEVRKRVLRFKGDSSISGRDTVERGKDEEKARAAAWAWYQHGKGGKESISGSGGASGLPGRTSASSSGSPHKSSRFKKEALKISTSSGAHVQCPQTQVWDFPRDGTSSSLFDSYELDVVSKRIDSAFHVEAPVSLPAKVPHDIPKLARSSSVRMQFPRTLCRSIADVVTREEMALGVDIRKCECPKVRNVPRGGWNFRRLSKAFQVFMHLPDCEYHPQLQHPERKQARENCYEHHHLHQHKHEHHHHIHYQVKLRDGRHYGNPLSEIPGTCEMVTESPREKDKLFSGLNLKMSPKVSPNLGHHEKIPLVQQL